MSGRTHIKRFRIRKHSVPEARHHVQALLRQWRLGCLIEDVSLVATELTTNVVQHARGTGDFFDIALRCRDSVLILEVSDSFRWKMPELMKPGDDDTGGRGLVIVDSLCEKWGVRPRDPGKTVWAHLPFAPEVSAGLPFAPEVSAGST
ncbi:ATP-binding protein [Streptomyces sp. NPDC050509]|uniref:ATP-binding protein n=1 Tax=Streptomyces sp. NPDC050509 TaxID=3365620 RepID=UPI0037A9F982